MTKSAWQNLLRLPRKNFPPSINIADIQAPPTLHQDPPLKTHRASGSSTSQEPGSSATTSSSSSSKNTSDEALSPPVSSTGKTALGGSHHHRGNAEKLRREFQSLVKNSKDDPVAAIWVKFVTEFVNSQDAICEFETSAGSEAYQDTFSNYDEVLDKSLDLLRGYIAAKKDPKEHGENFKNKCKELEAFSTYCSHSELALKLLKKKAKFLKDSSRLVQLEGCLTSPIPAIIEFSRALKQYSEEEFFPSSHFDEASAILEDVVDNIESVTKMFEDWRKTTQDPFRQLFFSPAKRTLLFVDPTVDFPTMVFSDYVIIFDVKADEQGEEQHEMLHQFPLSLLEIEEKGKISILKVPALSQSCQIKSPNNRAANTLRRKMTEAKEILMAETAVALSVVKPLPKDFPKVNCCVTSDHDLVLGTEKGLYTLDLQSQSKALRKIANTDQRISKLDVSENLGMVVFSQQVDPEVPGIQLFSHPLVALSTSPCIQKHIHPAAIELKPKSRLFCCFDTDKKSRRMLVSSENLLQLLQQSRDSEPVETVSTTVLEELPSFIKNLQGDVYIGTKLQVMKFNPSPPGIQGIFQIRDNQVPVDCVVLDDWHIFGFAEHGIVFDTSNKETHSTLVWADTAISLSVLGSHLLIFTKNFIEVRHKDCIWKILQIIPAPNITVLHETENYVAIDNQVLKIEIK